MTLVPSGQVQIPKKALRKICNKAQKESEPGYFITLKLMPLTFSVQELASSCGQGIGRRKSELPPLNARMVNEIKGKCHYHVCV